MNAKVWRESRKQDSGFSLIELVVAIGILGVIATIVGFMMSTSSKSYNRMSVETQLQSEAQLVANAISEYAVDSFEAFNKSDVSITYDNTDNKVLVLNSIEKIEEHTDPANPDTVTGFHLDKYGYVIARDTTANKLYIGERTYDAAADSWSAYNYSLLGNYIEDFEVDLSHVESENIINFKLTYTKNSRSYTGNYQVLMRNRAYADKKKENKDTPDPAKLILGLQPKQIYVDIVGGAVGENYYVNEISDANQKPIIGGEISLTATVTSNKSGVSDDVEWYLDGAPAGFSMPQAGEDGTGKRLMASVGKLTIDDSVDYDKTTIDDFTISIAKSMVDTDGSTVSAAKKQSKVHLRRVKSIRLVASSGSTLWKKSYEDINNSKPSDKANGYAYPDPYGTYHNMVINANIIQRWVPYAGGLEWKLEKWDDTAGTNGDWVTCDSAYASIKDEETLNSTTNTITFGKGIKNGQLYRVTAKSKFDNTKEGTYVFGIAPRERESGGGYNSRGFYVDLAEYLAWFVENQNISSLNAGDWNKRAATLQDLKDGTYKEIILKSGGNSFEDSGIKLIQQDGTYYLYLDYTAFKYSNDQKLNFYNSVGQIELNIKCRNGETVYLYYPVAPVDVVKVSPASNVLVIPRGASRDVKVQTKYYNILGPEYLGIYIDDDSTASGSPKSFSGNLSGINFDTDAYLTAEFVSSCGDVRHYVDNARVTLTGKNSLVYNSQPMTVRIAAEDYYSVCKSDDDRSGKANAGNDQYGNTYPTHPCTDYTVYIANVKNSGVFVSCPATTIGACRYPDAAKTATSTNPVDIPGYDANGVFKSNIAKGYKEGSQYKCIYGGLVYTYNQTYHYWYN